MTATSVHTLHRVYGKHMAGDLVAAAEAVARSGDTRKERANSVNSDKAKNVIKR